MQADGAAFDVETFHRRAVETPSHEDVAAMRDLLRSTLGDHGHDSTVDEAGDVLAHRGEGSPHLVLNTHVDTVPPHVPYERTTEEAGGGDQRVLLRGRGACDAKGPLAAFLAAFLAVEPDQGRLTLAITPDEETAQTGALHLADHLSPDAYLVGEPTGRDCCTAGKGRFEVDVTLSGESAHAASPDAGENAVAAATSALSAIRSFDDEADVHPDLGRPTTVPTVVRGGDATNQVPGRCTITVDRRPLPGETAAGFRDALAARVREHVPAGVDVTVDLADDAGATMPAWDTPDDDSLVAALRDAGAGPPRPFGAATEASHFAPDAPTVVFGPGDLADGEGPVAHADREYVRLSDLERAAAIATDAVASYLSGGQQP